MLTGVLFVSESSFNSQINHIGRRSRRLLGVLADTINRKPSLSFIAVDAKGGIKSNIFPSLCVESDGAIMAWMEAFCGNVMKFVPAASWRRDASSPLNPSTNVRFSNFKPTEGTCLIVLLLKWYRDFLVEARIHIQGESKAIVESLNLPVLRVQSEVLSHTAAEAKGYRHMERLPCILPSA